MSDSSIDCDHYTRAGSITKSYYRDVYPAIDPSRAELSLKGTVTIITGAGRGIGRAIAVAHAKAGVKGLVLITQSGPSGEETKTRVQAEYPSVKILTLPTDISDQTAVTRTFETIKMHFGTSHTLINNAAVFSSQERLQTSDSDTWWKDFEINMRGTYHVTTAFLRLVAETPDIRPTVVSLISTIDLTPPGLSSYFISKLGVAKFTEFVCAEHEQVVAYSLSPGIVKTSMTLEAFEPYAKDTAELTGAVTVYLAAERPDYLNGRHLSVNWDVEELEARKAEFASSNKLKVGQFL
ncbi:hypothetical protein BDV06DRAFT_228132 [Aspergillus oleicola]